MYKKIFIGFSILLSLAGCADNVTPGGRAINGGLLGAGAGAVLGTVTTGDPVAGAIIGGGVGAAAGAITAPRDPYTGQYYHHY
jgi:hypothetical protein